MGSEDQETPKRDMHPPAVQLRRGLEVIQSVVRTLPSQPGVYRMLDAQGGALYVGKAKNLKKRVTSYTRIDVLPLRLQRMVHATISMDIVVTHTEAEALLLEANLIKKLKPRFNILLRDDKSFPYVAINLDHSFPRLVKHRGLKGKTDEYFGPFASAGAVTETVEVLQKIFLLRTCTDSVFSHRSRPCLLYQIKRCCAPCVRLVTPDAYGDLIDQARSFLKGHRTDIQTMLVQKMEALSENLEFEEAAKIRDRLKALAHVLSRQDVNLHGCLEADVIGMHRSNGQSCIQIFFFRAGQNRGNRAYFPVHVAEDSNSMILGAFIGQFYAHHPPPSYVLVSEEVPDISLLEGALSLRAGHKVTVRVPKRGDKNKAVQHAVTNAREALNRRLLDTATQEALLKQMAEVFSLAAPPQRIEVYDNAHIQGAHPVGAMIVSGPEGFLKRAYRTFSIRSESMTPGDDFAMMREIISRRFRSAGAKDHDHGTNPDVIVIDGGAGQLRAVAQVFDDMGVRGVHLIAMAKGKDRNAGREVYHQVGCAPLTLPSTHPVHYFLQRLRDEAHRFVNGTHRAKRNRALSESPLDGIPGIGPRRKKALLHAFGSMRDIAAAGISDLAAVEGVSPVLAKKIYDYFRAGS